MYIVNTSFIVEPPVHGRWYELMTEKIIPHLRDTGFGARVVFTRALTDTGDAHYTYSLQVDVPDIPAYQRFMQQIVGEYATLAGTLFGEQTLHFSTLLKKIEV